MKKIMFLILLSIFMISSSAQAANIVRGFTGLTGEATGALDVIDCTDPTLTTGDIAIVVTGNVTYFYQYNSTDETAEASPLYINCDSDSWSAGNWILSGLTAGTILGKMNVVVTTDGSESPTAEQMYGTMFIADHGTATSDTDYTLPGAVTGMSACFYDNGGGAGGIIVDAAAGDDILLYGASNGAANAIDSPGVAGDGANGDFICILAIDANTWVTLGASGTWVGGGAD